MDAIILAAGRNQRLDSHIDPFTKPLLKPDGDDRSLVFNAVVLARWTGVERPVVVVSPYNAAAIHEELRAQPVDMVIQREPLGPGDALRIGLAWKPGELSDRVLVLLADNTMTQGDIASVTQLGCAIGVRDMHHDEAERFTWYDPDEHRWREKEPVPDRLPKVHCWVGPFVGNRKAMEYVLRHALPVNGEYLIGPYLDELTGGGYHIRVTSQDVGTTDSYLRFKRGEREL